MVFTKAVIVKFKRAGRRFTTYGGKKLTSDAISWLLEKEDGKCIEYKGYANPNEFIESPGKENQITDTNNIKAYNLSDRRHIINGESKILLKYQDDTGSYYLLYGHKGTSSGLPHGLAVGRLKGNEVYFIVESPFHTDNESSYLGLYKVPELFLYSYFSAYSVYCLLSESLWRPETELTDECVECVKIAYDGIKKFDKIIKAFLAEKPMPKNW